MLRQQLQLPNRTHPEISINRSGAPRKRISEGFVKQLKLDIAYRRIGHGFRGLHTHQDILDSCGPSIPNSAIFLGYLAQWIDVGFANRHILKKLLRRFDQVSRESLSVREYAHLHMAEGSLTLFEGENDAALRHFEAVLSFERDLKDKQLIGTAEYMIGRCLRRQGRYHDALPRINKAKQMMLELKLPAMAAVMDVLRAWIAFQQGNSDEATETLGEAEGILSSTDDYVTLGNINSIHGRIARRRGQYDKALSHFVLAIEEYKKRDLFHHNFARTLVNMAFVKRLFALQLRNKIDKNSTDRRKIRKDSAGDSASIQHTRKYLEKLRQEGFEHLDEAFNVYDRIDDRRGIGNAYITRAYLHLDSGDFDRATLDGANAHNLGVTRKDDVLQARSRILQALIECAKLDEEIGDGEAEAQSSLLVYEFARDAVAHAKCTQNKRLTAKAYIALGLAICCSAPEEMEAAWECCDQATALLNPENKDYVWRYLLQSLKNRLRNEGHIDSELREWSQGIVGNKTFQQVNQSFANIVIPRVWKREGRRISRVAARLSISPKKVRKILRAQGLLTEDKEKITEVRRPRALGLISLRGRSQSTNGANRVDQVAVPPIGDRRDDN